MSSVRRNGYSAGEKLKVVQFAEENGNRGAARRFGIGESTICGWHKMKGTLQTMPKSKCTMRGKTSAFPALEKDLMEWITDRRQAGLGIATMEIHLKALHIICSEPQYSDMRKSFKASACWCWRFMRRHDLSVRRRTTIAQKMPEDYKEKLVEYQRFIINQRKRHNYCIGNADQTPPGL